MVMPMPKRPRATPAETPKLRAVTVARLPPICRQVRQPCSQPSDCSSASTTRCVVPEREGEEMPTWPA